MSTLKLTEMLTVGVFTTEDEKELVRLIAEYECLKKLLQDLDVQAVLLTVGSWN